MVDDHIYSSRFSARLISDGSYELSCVENVFMCHATYIMNALIFKGSQSILDSDLPPTSHKLVQNDKLEAYLVLSCATSRFIFSYNTFSWTLLFPSIG